MSGPETIEIAPSSGLGSTHWAENVKLIITQLFALFKDRKFKKSSRMWLICIDTPQKRTKKTTFYVVPHLFSRLGGILGWGCHPLCDYCFFLTI